MEDILDHELAAFLDTLSLPANAETAINKPIESTRNTPTDWVAPHTETILEEAVETVTAWVDLPLHSPSIGNIFANGVKPAFRPRVASMVVESGAGRMVAKGNMSYVRLLGCSCWYLGWCVW